MGVEEKRRIQVDVMLSVSPSSPPSQAILVYKWRKSTVSSNLPLTATQWEIKITPKLPVRLYNTLPVRRATDFKRKIEG